MSESAPKMLNYFQGISSICMTFCENDKNKWQGHNDCGYHKSRINRGPLNLWTSALKGLSRRYIQLQKT